MTYHPHWGGAGVYTAMTPSQCFSSGMHVNDAETVLPIKKRLPKMKDSPSEMGHGERVAKLRFFLFSKLSLCRSGHRRAFCQPKEMAAFIARIGRCMDRCLNSILPRPP